MKNSLVWDKEAESYRPEAESSPDYIAQFFELEDAIGGNLKNKRILDVGSGTGITSAYLASKGAKLTLVDISRKALEFQKKYFRSKNLTAKYFHQDLFKMKFSPGPFDAVWSGGVIEHFPDEKKIEMLKIMWRLTAPGGSLIIIVPNAGDWPFMIAKQILILRKKWAFGFEDDLTATRLINLAHAAGIQNVSTYAFNPVSGWWFFPWGKEVTAVLGLNQVRWHRIKCRWGHALILMVRKT